MAPDELGNLVFLDTKYEGGRLLASGLRVRSLNGLRVSWYSLESPPGSLTLGDGVAYVYRTDELTLERMPPVQIGRIGDQFDWNETAQGIGLMLAMVLPEGFTIAQPVPMPCDVKAVNNRVAVYWMPEGSYGAHVQVRWMLEIMRDKVDLAVTNLWTWFHGNTMKELYRILDGHFNRSELIELCFFLRIDYDNLEGETKNLRAMSLITYLERRKRLGDLITQGRELRPDVKWPTL